MKYKLGDQRPLDIRDFRAKKRPSIVGVLLLLSAALLVVGLLAHFALQLRADPRLLLPVALGVGTLLVGWGAVTVLPREKTD